VSNGKPSSPWRWQKVVLRQAVHPSERPAAFWELCRRRKGTTTRIYGQVERNETNGHCSSLPEQCCVSDDYGEVNASVRTSKHRILHTTRVPRRVVVVNKSLIGKFSKKILEIKDNNRNFVGWNRYTAVSSSIRLKYIYKIKIVTFNVPDEEKFLSFFWRDFILGILAQID